MSLRDVFRMQPTPQAKEIDKLWLRMHYGQKPDGSRGVPKAALPRRRTTKHQHKRERLRRTRQAALGLLEASQFNSVTDFLTAQDNYWAI